MNDFNDGVDAAVRQGRMDGLRLACGDVVREYHPRLAKAVQDAIESERDEKRLIQWIVEAGRKRPADFAALVLGPGRVRRAVPGAGRRPAGQKLGVTAGG